MKSSHWKYIFGAVLALLAISAFAGHPILSPDGAMALTAIPFMIGDTKSIGELTDLIVRQGQAWEAFKEANDARITAIERKGYAPADLTEKVERINADLAAIGKSMTELEKKVGRPQPGGDGDQKTRWAELNAALREFGQTGNNTKLIELSRKAMNTQHDDEGGYLVLPELEAAIDRVAMTMGAFGSLARTVTINTAEWVKDVKKTGMSMTRVGEGATGGETTEPTFAEVRIRVFPAEVEPWINNETLEDARIDLAADLTDEAAIGFAEGANAEYITGTGVGQCRGIASYTMIANASYAWGSVGYVVTGKSSAFASSAPADDIIDLQHSLKAQYRAGAGFLCNDATLGQIRQIKDGSGNYYLWQPDPAGGFGGRLLGSPVWVDDNVASIGAASLSLCYINPQRAYTIVNRSGTTLIRDNITAKGKTKFNFRRRFGGGINNFEALKWLKFGTS